MDLAKTFRLTAKAEIAYVSGILQITIEHPFNFLRLCMDALSFLFLGWVEIHTWSVSTLFPKAIMVFASIGTLADLAYQMGGPEVIEFSSDGLRIRTSYLGWERDLQYPLDKCSELSWQPDNNRHKDRALECKVGWKKVRFGRYLNETQTSEILTDLQRYLPDVAQRIGLSLGSEKSHFTRLGLR